MTASPSFGFSAVTKKLWNTFCSIKAGMEIKLMRPYKMQLERSSPSAPRNETTDGTKSMPSNARMMPPMAVT